jgi:hypothetical protein
MNHMIDLEAYISTVNGDITCKLIEKNKGYFPRPSYVGRGPAYGFGIVSR